MRRYFLAFLIVALAMIPAAGQDAQPPASDQGVARISLVRGDVSTRRGDAGDWTAGALNQPLVTSDGVATAAGARAEVQLDFADSLRLSDNAEAQIANLTGSQIQAQVGQGLVDYVVRDRPEASAEIDTPNLGVHPQGAGVFRVQVSSDRESVVTVREGSAEVSTPQGSVTVAAGQTITVEGTDEPQYQIADAAVPDEWDQWNEDRDRQQAQAQSWSHTDRYYTGVSDLDGYGRWVYVPGYGQVWQPGVGPGWSPYSDGRWVYEPAWGWTWVDAEPWGWAPYHYGRWFYYQTGWVWWPGPVTPYYRPMWAPAYVSFIGMGGGVSVGIGTGSMAWVALGPGDPFRPWWGPAVGVRVVEPLVVARPGVVVYANLNLMERDPHVAAAVVVVHANEFGTGRVVIAEHATPVMLRSAVVVRGAVPVRPVEASYRVSDRTVVRETLPRAAVKAPAHFYGARPAVAPATRSGFHSFGERPAAASAGEARPAGERGPVPVARGGAAAPAARGSEAKPAANGWHNFQPKPEKNDKKSDKKPDDKRGGGGNR